MSFCILLEGKKIEQEGKKVIGLEGKRGVGMGFEENQKCLARQQSLEIPFQFTWGKQN